MPIMTRRPNRAILFALSLWIWASPTLADENSDANSLFVAAMLAWDQANGVSDSTERLLLLQQVDNNLQQIITDHSSADLAVKLVVGDSIGTLSIPAARAALTQAEAVAAEGQVWTDCIAAPTALCVIEEAQRQRQNVPDAASNAYLDVDAVMVLARAGQFDAALDLAATIGPPVRDQALQSIAIAQGKAAWPTEAHTTADLIAAPFIRIFALIDIAGSEVDMYLNDQARDSLNAATKLTGALTDEGELRAALDGIVGAMANLGMTDDAQRIATGIANPEDRDAAFTAIAVAQARDGLLEAAIATAAMIADATEIGRAQSAIAVAQANAGIADAAFATAALLADPQRQATTLAGIAVGLSVNGQADLGAAAIDRATTAANSLTDNWERFIAFNAIGAAQAEMGLTNAAGQSFDMALTAADGLGDGDFRYFGLYGLVQSLADAGMPDQAQRAIAQARDLALAKPDDDWRKAQTLADIAQAAAEAGLHDLATEVLRRAIETALRSPTDFDRIANLSRIAVTMTRTTD